MKFIASIVTSSLIVAYVSAQKCLNLGTTTACSSVNITIANGADFTSLNRDAFFANNTATVNKQCGTKNLDVTKIVGFRQFSCLSDAWSIHQKTKSSETCITPLKATIPCRDVCEGYLKNAYEYYNATCAGHNPIASTNTNKTCAAYPTTNCVSWKSLDLPATQQLPVKSSATRVMIGAVSIFLSMLLSLV